MGVFQKTGIRSIAINTVDSITWIRQYGLRDGMLIINGLRRKKNGEFLIKPRFFKNIVSLRNNFSDKAIFYQVFYHRQYYLEQLLSIKAKYILDAGANIGLATLYFSTLYPTANILALEPEEENFQLLLNNTKMYPNVTSIEAALWGKDENIAIQNPDSLAASFIVESKTDALVPGLTVDTLLKKNNWGQIDILKMDIEGAEKEIFSADTNWLKKVKVLIIELHDNYKAGCTKTFFKALETFEYDAYFHHENIFIFFKQRDISSV
jgi:FkbM family methyltransferase